MKEGERPRIFGSEEDRSLLDRMVAAPMSVPEDFRLTTRRALEKRLSSPAPRLRPLALALAGSLLAGSALAYGLASRRQPPAQAASKPPVPSVIRPASRPPVVRPTPAAPPPAPARRTRRMVRVPELRAPVRAPGGLPPWPIAEEETTLEESGPAPPPPRLVIARQGRPEVSLVLAADRVVGSVRGTPVDLTIEPGQLVGKLGPRNVWLWLHGHQAEGEIGGIPVKLQLVETADGHQLRQGYSVRSSLSFGANRVQATSTSLAWFPGCEEGLTEIAAGTYQGRCGSGSEARVVIPQSWQRLPALTRFILLSFFLTERDPSLAPLFGLPD
jgi:hypothetical protein